MGHRASVAYTDGKQVSAHYSHWGAARVNLLDEITPRTPFGSGDITPDAFESLTDFLAEELDGEDVNVTSGGSGSPPVRPEPDWIGDDLETWAREAIDYLHHEAAYVVDTETWDVRAFATVRWLGNDPPLTDGELRHHDKGALVEVENASEYESVFGVEYDWEDEPMDADSLFEGSESPVQQMKQLHRDAISEEVFAAKVQDEYGDRIPTFSQYHPEDD